MKVEPYKRDRDHSVGKTIPFPDLDEMLRSFAVLRMTVLFHPMSQRQGMGHPTRLHGLERSITSARQPKPPVSQRTACGIPCGHRLTFLLRQRPVKSGFRKVALPFSIALNSSQDTVFGNIK